ncbi:MAG: T9SS type A sorting domain-containing protein [bacterium]|nr:MAG: T9SS type A sorting domain-containing protein [bacterium]
MLIKPRNKPYFSQFAIISIFCIMSVLLIDFNILSTIPQSPTYSDYCSNENNKQFAYLLHFTSDIAYSNIFNNRPILPDSLLSANQHFMIHYTTQGDNSVSFEDSNANSIPDRIEKIADAFEKSYQVEIDQFNYQLPPSFNQGANPYDIYVVDLTNNYAVTVPEDIDSTTWEQKNVSSYILFDNDFIGPGYHIQGDDAIKITAAHEFFHAIQLGYIFRKTDGFFFEMTAVWMEDQVFDGVDNYLYYIDYFFSAPDVPLNAVSYTIQDIFKHIYGSCIFAFYLAENFGQDAIRQIWQRMPDKTALEATSDLFKHNGTNFESEFVRFSLWNFFTGNRSRPFYSYDDSHLFPEISVEKDTIIDYFNEQFGEGYFLTANYYVFHPFESGKYKVSLSTAITQHWRLGVAVYDENTMTVYSTTPEKTIGIGEVSKDQTIVMVPCNVDRFTNPQHVYFKDKPEKYTFILRKERKISPILAKSFQIHQVFPNPFSGSVTFLVEKITNAPLTIRIFNIQGQEVDRMLISQLRNKLNQITWLASLSKKYLPSGIYFCQFSAGNFVEKKKVILCR